MDKKQVFKDPLKGRSNDENSKREFQFKDKANTDLLDRNISQKRSQKPVITGDLLNFTQEDMNNFFEPRKPNATLGEEQEVAGFTDTDIETFFRTLEKKEYLKQDTSSNSEKRTNQPQLQPFTQAQIEKLLKKFNKEKDLKKIFKTMNDLAPKEGDDDNISQSGTSGAHTSRSNASSTSEATSKTEMTSRSERTSRSGISDVTSPSDISVSCQKVIIH